MSVLGSFHGARKKTAKFCEREKDVVRLTSLKNAGASSKKYYGYSGMGYGVYEWQTFCGEDYSTSYTGEAMLKELPMLWVRVQRLDFIRNKRFESSWCAWENLLILGGGYS